MNSRRNRVLLEEHIGVHMFELKKTHTFNEKTHLVL